MKNNKLIDSFMEAYGREYYFFDALAKKVSSIIEDRIDEVGVKAIVSSRAKSVNSLRDKVNKRNSDPAKESYSTHQEVYSDIVDLAGVRVALYFPADIDVLTSIIEGEFDVIDKIDFPKGGDNKNNNIYVKKFNGYHARHFRVKLKSNDSFSQHLVEIQIASVLMHAWSEVEHDLDYKPANGSLSVEELMILDEINGMVISGNIALERLQTAMTERINDTNYVFSNHYDLASFISTKLKDGEIVNSKEFYSLFKSIGVLSKEKVIPLFDEMSKRIEDIRASVDRYFGKLSPEENTEKRSAFVEDAIILFVCRNYSEEVIELMLSDARPFKNEHKNNLLVRMSLRQKEKVVDEAMDLIATLGYSITDEVINLDFSKYEEKLNMTERCSSPDEAIQAISDFVSNLSLVTSKKFNREIISNIVSAAQSVVDKVTYNSSDK